MVGLLLAFLSSSFVAKAGLLYEVRLVQSVSSTLDVDIEIRRTAIASPFVLGTTSLVFNYNKNGLDNPFKVDANDGPWGSSDSDYSAIQLVSEDGFAGVIIDFLGGSDNNGPVVTGVFTRIATIRFTILDPSQSSGLSWRNIRTNTRVFRLASPGTANGGETEITASGEFITPTNTSLIAPRVAASIALLSGNNQTASILSPLADSLVVIIQDQFGTPFQGAAVTFSISSIPAGSSGHQLSQTTANSNVNGLAWTRLTLGSKVGTYVVTASSGSLAGSPVTLTATSTTGSAATISLTSGNNQTGAINTTLNPFVVTVTDAGGNAVQGTSVSFTVSGTPTGAGGQSLSDTSATTNSSGQASTVLTLGGKVGTYVVTASSGALAGSPVTFTATSTAGAAANISLTSGNNQSGAINTALNPFVVTVTDAGGNAAQGTNVTFAIGGTPTGATGQSLSVTNATTNSVGQASTVLNLGNKVGTYVVTASSGSLSGSPETFTATSTAGAAANISLTSGNNQSGAINTALNPLVVTLTDAGGNAVQGTNVTFAIGGTPTGATGQSLSVTSATTNSVGQASTVLTLGSKVGTYVVTASSGSLAGSPVAFTATSTAGSAASISIASGNNQSGAINITLNPFVVTVTDAGGNAVQGTSVSFTVSGTPTGAGGQSLSDTSATTNASGQASTVLTLGNKVGVYAVMASSGTLTGSPLTFTSNAVAGPAFEIMLSSGNNQSGLPNAQLADSLCVVASDAGGNPVQGLTVRFAIDSLPSAAVGHRLRDSVTVTDFNGRAYTRLILGNKVGTYRVTATATGLQGSPVIFRARVVSGQAAEIKSVSGSGQSAPILTSLPQPLKIVVRDSSGNPVKDQSVSFSIQSTPSGATSHEIIPTLVQTDSLGEASASFTFGSKVGKYVVWASASGLVGSPVVFEATATAGPAATLLSVRGNDQSKLVNSRLDTALTVRVQDAGGNPVKGVTVEFQLTNVPDGATGQGLTPTEALTDSLGEASTFLTLGSKEGIYIVEATAAGLAESPVSFTLRALSGAPTSVEKMSPVPTFRLEQNYPNPFNPETKLEFELPASGPAQLKIYDINGREIASLFDGHGDAGKIYQLKFSGANLPSGVYFSSLQYGDQRVVRKMILTK